MSDFIWVEKKIEIFFAHINQRTNNNERALKRMTNEIKFEWLKNINKELTELADMCGVHMDDDIPTFVMVAELPRGHNGEVLIDYDWVSEDMLALCISNKYPFSVVQDYAENGYFESRLACLGVFEEVEGETILLKLKTNASLFYDIKHKDWQREMLRQRDIENALTIKEKFCGDIFGHILQFL
jgi:hypothetical protein